MENSKDLSGFLDLIIRPAFAVVGGVIQYCNRAAQGLLLSPGTPISKLLQTGEEEYTSMESGCLYLSVCIESHLYGASVTRMDGFDVFVLEQDDMQPELQAMALAAKELREPLANMITAADRLEPSSENEQAYMQLLSRSLHQMLRIVGNMSDAVRYTGPMAPRQELRDMTAVIGEVFEKAAALADRAGVTVRFSNYPEPVLSMTDTEKLERAIYNILSNSIKFAEKGSMVDARLTKHGSKLHLTVRDTGSGIGDDLLGSVFSRHLRQPAIEDGRHGIGLGLVMIRGAATAHGGTVLIEKNGEAGTKLTMTLSIRKSLSGNLDSPRLKVDYTGGFDRAMIELSDVLPSSAFQDRNQ